MSDTNYKVEPDKIIIHPQWGTGWQTVLDQRSQEITMQLCILGLKLPLRRKLPYSQVRHIATVSRETWWSRVWLEHSIANPQERSPMPHRGWVYDILMTVKGGKKPIKIGTVKSPDIASEIEREVKQRLGLAET